VAVVGAISEVEATAIPSGVSFTFTEIKRHFRCKEARGAHFDHQGSLES
jgi:hypothetical protein